MLSFGETPLLICKYFEKKIKGDNDKKVFRIDQVKTGRGYKVTAWEAAESRLAHFEERPESTLLA